MGEGTRRRGDTEDFEGPPSVLRLMKYFLQTGGDPRLFAPVVEAPKEAADGRRTRMHISLPVDISWSLYFAKTIHEARAGDQPVT